MSQQRPVKTPDSKPAFNAGDEDQVNARKSDAKMREEIRRAGLAKILQHPESRAWLWAHIGDCGVFSACFTGNSTTFFNEGKRAVGLDVIIELTRDHPESYIQMIREQSSHKAFPDNNPEEE